MRRRINQTILPSPILTQFTALSIPVILPDTLRRSADHRLEHMVRRDGMQKAEIADEDALELGGVGVAGVRVAGLADDVVAVCEDADGGFGDVRCGFEVCSVCAGVCVE